MSQNVYFIFIFWSIFLSWHPLQLALHVHPERDEGAQEHQQDLLPGGVHGLLGGHCYNFENLGNKKILASSNPGYYLKKTATIIH
jgi:hypothetical protein